MLKLALTTALIALAMSACSDDGDNGTTANIETGYSSSTCQDGDILPTEFDGKYFFCSDNRWLLHNQEIEDLLQQGASSQSTADISTCQEGTTFTDGLSNYVCTGNQWVLVEPPISSSQILPIASSSSFKAKSSSSTKKISSSSVIAKSSSSKAECDGGTRLIWLQKAYTTDTSEYKIVKRDLWADACVNGKWGFPSNICDSAVAGKPVPSENKVINGIRYHIWCYDRLYFDLACDKEGDRDTIIDKNGEIKARLCYKNGGWSEIISESSSSISTISSSSNSSKSSSSSYISTTTFIDRRDMNKYNIVTIGEQTWMAENLRYETESSLCYNNCKYGRLYTFSDAMDHSYTCSIDGDRCRATEITTCPSVRLPFKGLCPSGWHIPSIDEWGILFKNSSKGLAAKTTWIYYDEDTGITATPKTTGTNEYKFNAYPTGYQSPKCNNNIETGSSLRDQDERATFWAISSTEKGIIPYSANLYVYILNHNAFISSNTFSVGSNQLHSIRCIKD